MKRSILLCLLFSLIYDGQAQFRERHALYPGIGFTASSYFGLHVDLNYIFDQKYSVQIGRAVFSRKATSLPADYSGNWLTLGSYPHESFHSTHLLLGHLITLNEKKRLNLNLRAGLSHVRTTRLTHWEKEPASFVGSNYSYETVEHKEIGYVINPALEWPFGKVIGLSFAPVVFITRNENVYGFNASVIFQLLSR